jgi:ATP-dependent helicase/nuclease subunit A
MRRRSLPDRFTPLLFPEMEAERVPEPPRLPDAEARAAALDVRRSFVVEAPAGSGKTGLLIQRYMKLLADEAVLDPEQVLAITYTNKAAGEMRDRVLAQLEKARRDEPAESDFERLSRELAGAVLERDRRLGWRLLEQPFRLNLRTIDSVCAQIARNLPVLSGSAAGVRPTEDAAPLFAEAARRTLQLLGDGGGDQALASALRDLLLHRDASLGDCQQLIGEMLSVRDQWGMLIPLNSAELDDEVLDRDVLPELQRTLEDAICAELRRIETAFPMDLLTEVADIAGHGYAAPIKADVSKLAPCAGRHDPPRALAEDRDRWVGLVHLLTTKGGEWRKERGITGSNLELEYDRKHPWHRRLCAVLDQLQRRDDLRLELGLVALIPDPVYPAAQWALAKSLFRVLRRALVELQMVFAERGVCDFTEVSLLARSALRLGAGREEMISALGGTGLQHLLVDEMQDTSTGQYELIQLLTQAWDGASQTVFLVGDPRQSIYLFRQARVEHFIHTLASCRMGELGLTHLRLTANFRSQRRLVEQFNEDFARVFDPGAESEFAGGALPYARADAVQGESARAEGRRWHARPVTVPKPGDTDAEVKAPVLRQRQARRNARSVRGIARRWLVKPLPAGRTEPWRIAVLVRNRRHLAEVVSEFQKEDAPGGRIPYRATEIDPLNERQEILDLLALTRALLHPADRVAGLALLRAPWCGLSLADLHMLTGADEPEFSRWSVMRLMGERGELLSADGCARMQRLWRVLDAAHRQRGRMSTAERVERAWRSLGGDVALTGEEMTNARRYFELLDEMEARLGAPPENAELDRRLQRLYAEPQTFGPETAYVELLTMHRAKGLEWDVVLLPALERWPGRNRPRLLTWAELTSGSADADDSSAMMLAPIAARGEDVDGLTRWLKRKYAEQEAAERKRLFYVAATRAREELHLFASPDRKETGEVKPAPGSLLRSAWSAAEPYFAPAASLESLAVARLQVTQRTEIVELAAAATVLEMPRGNGVSAISSAANGAAAGLSPEATEEMLYSKPPRPQMVRLPASFEPGERFAEARARRLRYRVGGGEAADQAEESESRSGNFSRPEGSVAARAAGNAIHALLELIAGRISRGETLEGVAEEAAGWRPRVAALLRADGIAPAEVDRLTRETMSSLANVLRDRDGRWVLAAHANASNEYALVGPRGEEDGLYSVRVDRTFLAGAEPHAAGEEYLWIVDYKAASHGAAELNDFLEEQRDMYAPQLEGYAQVFAAGREIPLERTRVALYYPALPRLVWWVPGVAD